MKIRFKIETGYDCEEDKPNATLVVEVRYRESFDHLDSKETFAIARRTFASGDDRERARWAGKTIAAALRQLVPEADRYQYPYEDR